LRLRPPQLLTIERAPQPSACGAQQPDAQQLEEQRPGGDQRKPTGHSAQLRRQTLVGLLAHEWLRVSPHAQARALPNRSLPALFAIMTMERFGLPDAVNRPGQHRLRAAEDSAAG